MPEPASGLIGFPPRSFIPWTALQQAVYPALRLNTDERSLTLSHSAPPVPYRATRALPPSKARRYLPRRA